MCSYPIRIRHKDLSGSAVLARLSAILIATLFATSLVTSAQSNPSRGAAEPSQFTPLKPLMLEAPYRPITPCQSLQWFITGTFGPAHLAGGIFLAASGTTVDRPKEHGPHWDGLANRYGMGMAGSATGNVIEASAGQILREDPRYFRVPERSFKARLGNVVKFTFAARGDNGSFGPAYARYTAIVGGNFLSNTWRVHSEANSQDALLRASEGFAGRMAANAFEEFWPDVKRRVFRKRGR